MNQDDLDTLKATGLKPIVIDENFDFSQLNGLLAKPSTKDEIIDQLWASSNHGTRREDVVAAFEAGMCFKP